MRKYSLLRTKSSGLDVTFIIEPGGDYILNETVFVINLLCIIFVVSIVLLMTCLVVYLFVSNT